jgi:hypothetical protein
MARARLLNQLLTFHVPNLQLIKSILSNWYNGNSPADNSSADNLSADNLSADNLPYTNFSADHLPANNLPADNLPNVIK